MNILINEQHAIGERLIDIINFIESEYSGKLKVDNYYVLISQKKHYDRIKRSMPPQNTKIIYIYDGWHPGTVGKSEIMKIRELEKRIRQKDMNLYRFALLDIARGDLLPDEKKIDWAIHWHINYFNNFFNANKIDIVIGFVPETLSNFCMYALAKDRGIPCCFVENSRIWNQIFFFDNYFAGKEGVAKKYDELLSRPLSKEERRSAERLLEEFEGTAVPEYIAKKLQVRSRDSMGIIKKVLMLPFKLIAREEANEEPYYRDNKIAYYIQLFRSRLMSFIIKKDIFRLFETPKAEDFFYFPLHYQPETSTTFFAPHYENYIEVIKNIAISLPFGFKLYVKEHPSMAIMGFHPVNYYKEIKKIPNVRLIKLSVPSKQLIKDSKGVVVITGTTAFEAILMQKPAIIIGDVVFARAEGLSIKVNGYAELYDAFKKALEMVPNKERLLKYLTAVSSVSYSGLNLLQKFQLGEEDYINNYRRLAKILTDKILENVKR